MSEFPSPHDDRSAEKEGESEPLSRLVARYWILFKKYYWILIATCVLGVVGAYFYTQQQPKVYQASAKIIFRETLPNVFGRSIERVDLVDPGGMWQFEQFWNTQKEVMRSRWFAEKVVEFEGLVDEEGFVSGKGDPEALKKQASQRVLAVSDVKLQPNSRVAIVTVETTNPRHAKLVADGVADTYVQYTRDFQSGGLSKIIEWFDDYVGQKRIELTETQTNLHTFKKDNNILSISYEERQNLTATNMDAVNAQLNEVRAQLDADAALLTQLAKMAAGDFDDARAVAHIVQSDVLNAAIASEQVLRQELAKVTTTYGEKHDLVRGITRQLETVHETILGEVSRIHRGVEATRAHPVPLAPPGSVQVVRDRIPPRTGPVRRWEVDGELLPGAQRGGVDGVDDDRSLARRRGEGGRACSRFPGCLTRTARRDSQQGRRQADPTERGQPGGAAAAGCHYLRRNACAVQRLNSLRKAPDRRRSRAA